MEQRITGRFAPTPSGALHLGNIYCAMLSYLSARVQGGRFLLRIEDVDVPRCPRRLAEQCIRDLTWFGFRWDEPPLYQSERSGLYAQALQRLREQGRIYSCFCTRAELHNLQAPNLGDGMVVYPGTCRNLTEAQRSERSLLRTPSLRLRVPEETVCFEDGLCGEVRIRLAEECGDCILQRSDGLFSYQLAVVVDDALSGVTEIVRGRDILSATGWHRVLQEALGYPVPAYVHVPLLTDCQGRRLAKRDKDLGIEALSERFTPEQLLGFLAYAAGLLEAPEPRKLEQLIPCFSWNKVKTQDIRLPAQLSQ